MPCPGSGHHLSGETFLAWGRSKSNSWEKVQQCIFETIRQDLTDTWTCRIVNNWCQGLWPLSTQNHIYDQDLWSLFQYLWIQYKASRVSGSKPLWLPPSRSSYKTLLTRPDSQRVPSKVSRLQSPWLQKCYSVSSSVSSKWHIFLVAYSLTIINTFS